MAKAISLAALVCVLAVSAHADRPPNEPTPEPSPSVEAILARLESRASAMQTLKTKFIQEKRLAVLSRPLVLRGTISMQKPSLFAWHVTEPLRYSLVIQGEVVRQWDEDSGRIQQMSLSSSPPLKIAIRQMRNWFSGAYISMTEEYEVTVVKHFPVTLKFIPRDSAFAREVIDSIVVVFEEQERYIRQIQMFEKGGDTTLLTFVDTLFNTPIDPSAWKLED
jgi:outer membrane lipoprotein-sorting protein